MRPSQRRLQRSMMRLQQMKQDVVEEIPGTLGTIIDGEIAVTTPERRDFCYVRLYDNPSQVVEAYNDQTLRAYDLRVIVVYDKHLRSYRVKGKRASTVIDYGGQAFMANHGWQHSLGLGTGTSTGGDPVWIAKKQFMPFLAQQADGHPFSLFINPDYYIYGREYNWFSGSITNSLEGAIPDDVASARFMTVYFDMATQTLGYATGTVFTWESEISDPTTLIEVPQGTTQLPIAAVMLHQSMTKIRASDIWDMRQFMTASTALDPRDFGAIATPNLVLAGPYVGGPGLNLYMELRHLVESDLPAEAITYKKDEPCTVFFLHSATGTVAGTHVMSEALSTGTYSEIVTYPSDWGHYVLGEFVHNVTQSGMVRIGAFRAAYRWRHEFPDAAALKTGPEGHPYLQLIRKDSGGNETILTQTPALSHYYGGYVQDGGSIETGTTPGNAYTKYVTTDLAESAIVNGDQLIARIAMDLVEFTPPLGYEIIFPRVTLRVDGNTFSRVELYLATPDVDAYSKAEANSRFITGTVAGSGDVTGPASAVDNHLAVFDGTTGKLLKDGGAIPAGGGSSLFLDDISDYGSGDQFAGTGTLSGWTSLQSTSLTNTDRSVPGYAILKNTGNTGGQDRGIQRSFVPAGDFTAWCKVLYLSTGPDYVWGGLLVGAADPSDGASGHRLQSFLVSNGNTIYWKVARIDGGSETTIFNHVWGSSSTPGIMLNNSISFPIWLSIRRSGSTLYVGISLDGVQFIEHSTTTTIAFTVETLGLLLAEATATRDIRMTVKYIATTG